MNIKIIQHMHKIEVVEIEEDLHHYFYNRDDLQVYLQKNAFLSEEECTHKFVIDKTVIESPPMSDEIDIKEFAYIICEKCGETRKELIKKI